MNHYQVVDHRGQTDHVEADSASWAGRDVFLNVGGEFVAFYADPISVKVTKIEPREVRHLPTNATALPTCRYVIPWVGRCGKPEPCPEHHNRVCNECGAPATHGCGFAGQFVCGADLCDAHEECSNHR